MNFKPRFRTDLLAEEKSRNPLGKNLSTAAGHCAQACIFQLQEDFLNRHFEFLVEKIYLDGGKRFYIDGGKCF